jgi:hypothetical protein
LGSELVLSCDPANVVSRCITVNREEGPVWIRAIMERGPEAIRSLFLPFRSEMLALDD